MHYISEFTRSKPIAVCVALKMPKAKLPLTASLAADPQTPRNWRKNWRTQTHNALKAIGVERRNSSQPYYHALLDDLAQDVTNIYVRLQDLASPESPMEDRLVLVQDLRTLGRYEDACHFLSQMVEEMALDYGIDSLELADSHLQLADMKLASGQHPEARRQAQLAQDIYISNRGPSDLQALQCELILAEVALHQEALDVVQEVTGNVLACADAAGPPACLVEGRALHLLALAEGKRGHFPLALENAHRASSLLQDSESEDPSLPAKYLAFEGILYRKMAKWAEAEACFAQAYDQLQTLFPAQHIDMGRITLETGRFYMLKEDFDRAGQLLEQAQAVFAKLDHARLERLIAATFTARLSRLRGQPKLAKRMVRRGLKACDKLHVANAEWKFRIELEQAHLMLLDGKFAAAGSILVALLNCPDRLTVPSQRGELYLLLGRAQWEQQDRAAAKSSLQQALQFLQDPMLVAEDQHLRSRVLLDLAELRLEEQEPAKALQAVQEAQRNLDLHTFEQDLLAGRSDCLQGRIAVQAKDYPLAQSHFRQALVNLEGRDPHHDSLAATCRLWLGHALLEPGANEEALAVLHPLVDSKAYKGLPTDEDRLRALYFLALALFAEGQMEASFKYSQRAYKRLGKLPGTRLTLAEQYDMRQLMGSLHMWKGQYQSVIDVLQALLTDLNAHLSQQPETQAHVHDGLAQAHLHLGHHAEAEKHWRQSLTHLRQYHDEGSQNVFRIRARLAEVLERQDKLEAALQENLFLYANSLASRESREQLCRQYVLAKLHFRLGHMDQAQSLVEQLLHTPAKLQRASQDPLEAALLLGQIHIRRRHLQVARTTLQEALTQFGQREGDPVVAEVHSTLAALLEQEGEWASAIECHKQALAILQSLNEYEQIWQCLQKLARLLWRGRRQEESLAYSAAALKLASSHSGHFKKPRVIRLCLDRGQKYASMGNPNEALKCYRRGLDLANVKKSRKHVALASQCLLATAELLPSRKAEQRFEQVQKLYGRKGVPPDTTLALCCMQYGLSLWDRNEMEAALQQMTTADEAYQHVANQSESVAEAHDWIMTLQYLVLLHADLGHWDQASELLDDRLLPIMQGLPRKSRPRQLSLETVREQRHLMHWFQRA